MKSEISREEIIDSLESEKTLVLATCAANRVTVRPMSHINDGLEIFFQTSSASLKMMQIRENPLVALCIATFQIEGYATILGHPLAIENNFFVEKYKAKHPSSFERYSSYSDEIVIKVEVQKVKQWRYIDGEPLLAETDFIEEENDNEN